MFLRVLEKHYDRNIIRELKKVKVIKVNQYQTQFKHLDHVDVEKKRDKEEKEEKNFRSKFEFLSMSVMEHLEDSLDHRLSFSIKVQCLLKYTVWDNES